MLDDDWDRIEAVLWVAWKALADEVRDGQGTPRPRRPDQPARGQGGHPAPGQVAGDEQQPGDDRDHRRHRGGDGRAEQQEQGRLADPGPGGTTSSSGPLAKAAANAPVHCSHSSAPPSAPRARASRYTWTP